MLPADQGRSIAEMAEKMRATVRLMKRALTALEETLGAPDEDDDEPEQREEDNDEPDR